MKKGLFSILASALLVVGCQNYDDQFDNLETQINALASVVAGLSQVQSDITSLSGTVASLQSSVAGTVATAVDTALADGLANIDTAVASLEAATATAASSADVAAIAAAVAAQSTDLEELLANSSVFNNSLTVNSVATLDAFYAMGSSLNIVNGSVNITVSAGMDATKVQGLIDNILTVTGDFNYSAASTEAMPTFLNLTGVQSTTIKGAGEYRLDNLISAGNIVLDNSFKSKVTIVHLGALTTYTKISDNAGVSGVVDMGSATEFHLTSLAIPVSGKLDIKIKKGGVLALTALTGLNSLGTTQVMDLDFDGPSSITLANIKDGAIDLKNVTTATISDFYGNITIGSGVENVSITKGVSVTLAAANDLITATIDMATDYDPLVTGTNLATALKVSSYNPMNFASQDLTSATISGKVGTLTVNAQNNLTTLTVTGHATALVVTGNNDLETLTVTGATIGNVTVDNNDNMINLTLDHTTYVTAVAANLGRAISVDDNADLETLTINADKIDDLSIQRNTDLVTITAGAKLLTIGEATATVAIDNNNLTALIATDNYQATGTAAAPVADAGTYDDGTSGMKTFKTYLKAAAAAPTATGVKVFFDVISSYQVQGSTAASAYTDTAIPTVAYTASNIYAVAYVAKSNATTTGNTIYETDTVVLPVLRTSTNADTALAANDGITISDGVGSKIFATGAAPAYATVDLLVAAINGDTTIAGLTVEADRNAYNEQLITLAYTNSDGTANTASNTSGVLYFTYGTDPETGAPLNITTGAITNKNASQIAAIMVTAFNSATHAYVASESSGVIRIAALVSGTLNKDNSPISHAFQTLNVLTTSASSTKLLAGATASYVQDINASSNVTAIASGFFNFVLTDVRHSGMRVTLKNTSATTVRVMTVVLTTATTSTAFVGNDTAVVSNDAIQILTSGALIANVANSAGFSSNTLKYLATFAQRESPTTSTNSAGTTNRTLWLGA